MKKLFLFLISFFAIFSLVACSSSSSLNENIPLGGLSDNTYASLGNSKITEKELYNQMRSKGFHYFTDLLVETLIDSSSFVSHVDELKDLINEKCYGTTDLDSLSTETKQNAVTKFVDSMASINVTTSADNIYNAEVLNYFAKTLAIKAYAKSLITSEKSKYYYKNEYQMEDGNYLLDENDNKIKNSYYVSNETLETFYNSKLEDEKTEEVIILGFYTYNDAKEALAKAGVELDENGTFTSNNAKDLFESIYENVYSYRPTDYVIDNDTLGNYSTSLISLIADLKAGEYTHRIQEYGNLKYLVYKVADNDEKEFADLDDNQKAELMDEKIDSLVTDDFQTEALNHLVETTDIVVYDPLYSKLFKNSYADYTELTSSEWKAEYANLVAKVGNKEIKVTDLYSYLERYLGITTATSYFVNEIYANKIDSLTEDEIKTIESNIESTLNSFKDGSLASSGYPTTLTEAEFNYLYYGVSSSEDVLKLSKVAKVKENLKNEYPDEIFDILEKFSKQYNDNYFYLKITHLLLYVDYDMDGSIDDPELFINRLSSDEARTEFNNALVKISDQIMKEVNYIVEKEYATVSDAMSFVAKEYAKGTTLLSDNTKNWNDFKAFNIAVKVENLGAISTSNYASYVKPFSNGVRDLYNTLKAKYAADETLDANYEYVPEEVTSVDELIQTSYGYHLLTSQGTIDKAITAEYSSNDNFTITWKGEEDTLSALNNNVWANKNQLKIYMAQMVADGKTELATSICKYIEGFYSSFASRYQNSTFQEIYHVYQEIADGINFTNDVNKALFYKNLEINKRVFDSYEDYSLTSKQVFAGWWELFGCVAE